MKVRVVKTNDHKYSVSAMCVHPKNISFHLLLSMERKVRREGKIVYCHCIGRIMQQEDFVSNYITDQWKTYILKCNGDEVENVLNQNFHNKPKY